MAKAGPAVEHTARTLYDNPKSTPRPRWDQLGEVTKSVWREYAVRKLAGVKDWWATIPTTRAAGVLRRLHQEINVSQVNNESVAEALDEIAELFVKLAGAFRASGGGGKAAGGDGKARGKAKPAKEEAKDPADLTEDDVREALKELAAAKGKDAMVEALESVGAAKLADVDESQYQELIDKVNELKEAEDEPPPAKKPAAKKPAGKAKKPAGPTLEDLTEAAKKLIAADKPAFLKISKKFGKPSEVDEDQYGPMLEAINAALGEEEDLGDGLL